MCLGQFYFEKKQKNGNPCAIGVDLQISILKQTYIFSHDTSCLWYSIKFQTRGVPQAICAQRRTTTCMSHHIKFKVAARLVPPNDPINACALSLGPRLSLFSGVSYRPPLPNKRLLSDKRPLCAV